MKKQKKVNIFYDATIDGWRIIIDDSGTIFKKNVARYGEYEKPNTCVFKDCVTKRKVISGRCHKHQNHRYDAILKLTTPSNIILKPPSHGTIVKKLTDTCTDNEINIDKFYKFILPKVLGKIPDMTSHSRETILPKLKSGRSPIVKNHKVTFPRIISCAEKYFSNKNYKEFEITFGRKKTDRITETITTRVLACIFSGLILCEETNRGDRWFCNKVLENANLTTQLGGIMPLRGYAATQYSWKVPLPRTVLNKIR